MIRYLIDSSALWRVMREAPLRSAWGEVITAAAVGSCHPQRVEFRRSARNPAEFEQMNDMFAALYPTVPISKGVWRWADAAQYRLVRAGAHQAPSTVDLLICGTAAISGLIVLHDDNDFVTAAAHLDDVFERSVRDVPGQAV